MVLAEKAAAAVEQALAEGDGKTATALLKRLGLLSGQLAQVGSDDPGELEEETEEMRLLGRRFGA
jgi:hypothetical protein